MDLQLIFNLCSLLVIIRCKRLHNHSQKFTSVSFAPTKNDQVCHLVPDAGPCSRPVRLWYWNRESGRCTRFTYGGCMGNENKFASRQDCKRFCRKTAGRRKATRLRRLPGSKQPEYCHQPKQNGHCENNPNVLTEYSMWYYYYNTDRNKCQLFWFWGCGGNRNKFKTKGGCERHCVTNHKHHQLSAKTQCVHCDPQTSVCEWYPDNSYSCVCKPGFERNYDDYCVDINECATDPAVCDANALCENDIGTYRCWCKDGFIGNGKTCRPQSEQEKEIVMSERLVYDCSRCDHHAQCVDNVCVCDRGFTGDGYHCADVNECLLKSNPCGEHTICENTIGSYHCECDMGYAGNGFKCTNTSDVCLEPFDSKYGRSCLRGDWQPRYFFDRDQKTCTQFWYDGCAGESSNFFADVQTCEAFCEDHIQASLTDTVSFQIAGSSQNAFPFLEACLDEFDDAFGAQCHDADWQMRVFYNSTSRLCELFWYDKCDGHGNNIFRDLKTCRWMCEGVEEQITRVKATTEVNLSAMTSTRAALNFSSESNLLDHPLSPCFERFDTAYADQCGTEWQARFYYDQSAGVCRQFWYDGCQGSNRNIFDSRVQCVDLCVDRAEHQQQTNTFLTVVSSTVYQTVSAREAPTSTMTVTQNPVVIEQTGIDGPQEMSNPQPDVFKETTTKETAHFSESSAIPERKRNPNDCLASFSPTSIENCVGHDWLARYFYDAVEAECVQHWWDGCTESDDLNWFEELDQCRQLCQHNILVQIAHATGQRVPWIVTEPRTLPHTDSTMVDSTTITTTMQSVPQFETTFELASAETRPSSSPNLVKDSNQILQQQWATGDNAHAVQPIIDLLQPLTSDRHDTEQQVEHNVETPKWDPLGLHIKPGNLKPGMEEHPDFSENLASSTFPSTSRPVIQSNLSADEKWDPLNLDHDLNNQQYTFHDIYPEPASISDPSTTTFDTSTHQSLDIHRQSTEWDPLGLRLTLNHLDGTPSTAPQLKTLQENDHEEQNKINEHYNQPSELPSQKMATDEQILSMPNATLPFDEIPESFTKHAGHSAPNDVKQIELIPFLPEDINPADHTSLRIRGKHLNKADHTLGLYAQPSLSPQHGEENRQNQEQIEDTDIAANESETHLLELEEDKLAAPGTDAVENTLVNNYLPDGNIQEPFDSEITSSVQEQKTFLKKNLTTVVPTIARTKPPVKSSNDKVSTTDLRRTMAPTRPSITRSKDGKKLGCSGPRAG